MESISFWIGIINMMGILITSIYVFGKSINLSLSFYHRIILILWCLFWTSLSIVTSHGMSLVIFVYIATIVFIWLLIKIKLDTVISAYLLSLGVTYSTLNIAMFIVAFVFAPFLDIEYADSILYEYNDPTYLFAFSLVTLMQFLLSFLLFRIKRFRNGFPFLFERYAVILALVVAGVVFTMVLSIASPRDNYNDYYLYMLIVGVIITGVGIIIWIRRGIKLFYKHKIKERNVEILEQKLTETKIENNILIDQNNVLRIANHKIMHRLAALERSAVELYKIAQNESFEFSGELAITIDDINRMSQDYQCEVNQMKRKISLSTTKIQAIDDLFSYFQTQCSDNGINFALKINGSIPYMIEQVISQSKLETMIGDHLQDAIIAINASNNSFRSILVILGVIDDYYELKVYDSGIPFSPDTLTRLGTEQITTHSDTGGSGIGFMTTFETMRECGASLVICEKEQSKSNFSKSVTIRFDGKNQYVIESYRPNEFPKSDRYTVVDTKG